MEQPTITNLLYKQAKIILIQISMITNNAPLQKPTVIEFHPYPYVQNVVECRLKRNNYGKCTSIFTNGAWNAWRIVAHIRRGYSLQAKVMKRVSTSKNSGRGQHGCLHNWSFWWVRKIPLAETAFVSYEPLLLLLLIRISIFKKK